MEELNTPIFAQAKVEYTSQLIDILYPHMFDGVKSIYDESKILYRSRNKTPVLLIFRELLEKHVKTLQKASLKLPPHTRKLFINHPVNDLFRADLNSII